MDRTYSMDDIMNVIIGEDSSTIEATFRKTINVKQYETEVIESNASIKLSRDVSGIERMILTNLLQTQLEYEAYVQLYMKGYIGPEQFNNRKEALEKSFNVLMGKGREILGKDIELSVARAY